MALGLDLGIDVGELALGINHKAGAHRTLGDLAPALFLAPCAQGLEQSGLRIGEQRILQAQLVGKLLVAGHAVAAEPDHFISPAAKTREFLLKLVGFVGSPAGVVLGVDEHDQALAAGQVLEGKFLACLVGQLELGQLVTGLQHGLPRIKGLVQSIGLIGSLSLPGHTGKALGGWSGHTSLGKGGLKVWRALPGSLLEPETSFL